MTKANWQRSWSLLKLSLLLSRACLNKVVLLLSRSKRIVLLLLLLGLELLLIIILLRNKLLLLLLLLALYKWIGASPHYSRVVIILKAELGSIILIGRSKWGCRLKISCIIIWDKGVCWSLLILEVEIKLSTRSRLVIESWSRVISNRSHVAPSSKWTYACWFLLLEIVALNLIILLSISSLFFSHQLSLSFSYSNYRSLTSRISGLALITSLWKVIMQRSLTPLLITSADLCGTLTHAFVQIKVLQSFRNTHVEVLIVNICHYNSPEAELLVLDVLIYKRI